MYWGDGGHVNWCRWVDCTGVWRLPDTAERDWCHLWALVVWEVGQYDVLSQDEGALSVAQARQQDTAQQVLHQEGLDSWLYHSLITTDHYCCYCWGFSTRRHICRARYIRLSVCLSLGWISQKWLKLGLPVCNFHHTIAPFLSFCLIMSFQKW